MMTTEKEPSWQDVSCSCHISPPCWKCLNTPDEEELISEDFSFEPMSEGAYRLATEFESLIK